MADIPVTLLDNIDRIAKYLEQEVKLKKEMTEILRSIASSIGKQESSISNLEKATENLKETVQDVSDEIIIESGLIKKSRELFSKATETYSASTRLLTDNFKRLKNSTLSTITNIEKGDVYFSKLFEQLEQVGGKLGKIAAGAAFLFKQLENNINLYRRLVMAGVQLEGGLLEMRKLFKDLGLYTTDAIEVLTRNASLVNRLTTKNLAEFSDAIDQTILDLVELGIPYNEIKKWSIEYLAIQRNLGKLRELGMKERADVFDETLKQFYRSTQWLGINIAEFVNRYKKLTEEPKTRTALQQLPETSRRLVTVLSEILPSEIVDAVVESFLLGAVERTDQYTDLVVSGLVPFVTGITELIKRPGTTVDDLVNYIKQTTVENNKIQRLYIAGFDKQARLLAELALAKRKMADRITATLSGEEREATATQKWMRNVTDLRIKIFDLQSKLLERAIELFKKYPQLSDAIVNAMGTINDFLDSNIFKLIDFTMSIVGGVYNTIKTILDFIFSPLGIPEFISSLTAGAATFGIANALKKIVGKTLVESAIIPAAKAALKGVFSLAGFVMKSKYGRIAAGIAALSYAGAELLDLFEEKKGGKETVSPEMDILEGQPLTPPPGGPTQPPPPRMPTIPQTTPLNVPQMAPMPNLEKSLTEEKTVPEYTPYSPEKTYLKIFNEEVKKLANTLQKEAEHRKEIERIVKDHSDMLRNLMENSNR